MRDGDSSKRVLLYIRARISGVGLHVQHQDAVGIVVKQVAQCCG